MSRIGKKAIELPSGVAFKIEGTEAVVEGPKGAALQLGLHPNTLRSRMKKLGIVRPPHDMS